MDHEYHSMMTSITKDPPIYYIGRHMGSHSVQLTDKSALLVEWYNFGEDVLYEYVSQLTISRDVLPSLAKALGMSAVSEPKEILETLAESFCFFSEIEQFAKDNSVPFERSTDFRP